MWGAAEAESARPETLRWLSRFPPSPEHNGSMLTGFRSPRNSANPGRRQPPGSRGSGRLGAMPLMRLIAENIGPFERLDVDFSDGSGNRYRGPHIFAGVNGSGKSTVLRAIAWAVWSPESGFPLEEWRHFLRGPESRALVQVSGEREECYFNVGPQIPPAGYRVGYALALA
jgi:hypothetical protein